MDTSQRYQVVLVNQYEDGIDLESVKLAFARQFKLSTKVVQHLFSQDVCVIKKGLDAETAAHYKIAIDAIGANCRVEYMPNTQKIKEKRRGNPDRRQVSDRRQRLREGTIQPDRRLKRDRRQD